MFLKCKHLKHLTSVLGQFSSELDPKAKIFMLPTKSVQNQEMQSKPGRDSTEEYAPGEAPYHTPLHPQAKEGGSSTPQLSQTLAKACDDKGRSGGSAKTLPGAPSSQY